MGDHCATCSTTLEEWEGQNGPREYWYQAREVAYCLRLVAQGLSYRQAAYQTRIFARRLRPHRPRGGIYPFRRRTAALDGQLAANWVDVFTPIVTALELPSAWPERIAADPVGFHNSSMGVLRAGQSWHVLCVVGYEHGHDLSKVWALQPSPESDGDAWAALFASKSGTPKVIVTDQGKETKTGARMVFPQRNHAKPHYHHSEGHIKRLLTQKMHPLIRDDEDHVVMRRLRNALLSEREWDMFKEELHKLPHPLYAPLLKRYIGQSERWLRPQIRNRPRQGPYSTGAVEGAIQKVGEALDIRARSMTNYRRAEKLLQLIQLELNGQVDELAWAERIREVLLNHDGRAPRQRPHDDPQYTSSLTS